MLQKSAILQTMSKLIKLQVLLPVLSLSSVVLIGCGAGTAEIDTAKSEGTEMSTKADMDSDNDVTDNDFTNNDGINGDGSENDGKINSGISNDSSDNNGINNDTSDNGSDSVSNENAAGGEDTMMFSQRDKKTVNKDNCMIEPMLQNPTEHTCTVQWFTEGETQGNYLNLYDSQESEKPYLQIEAKSFKMSRLRGGNTEKSCNDQNKDANIYKHVATAIDLPIYHGLMSERIYYNVESQGENSDRYTLAAAPAKGTNLKILLTSDLQIKSMCAANIEKAYEEAGSIDYIFCDGDIVDVCDRAYDWFYADNALFRILTGTADSTINGVEYHGAPLLQETPMYTAIGNHDVMGVYDNSRDLSVQFNYPSTREHAEKLWENSNKSGDKEEFIQNHSFNTRTYEEIFELPKNQDGNSRYYAVNIGDVGLISLELARVWRLAGLGGTGKYSELAGTGEDGEYFGFGDFIFEPITKGSKQYDFLKKQLDSDNYRHSKYKVVMFHSEAHSLGDNQIPAYTDPVANIVIDPVSGLPMETYDYPIEEDYIATIVEPLLEEAGTNLLFEAHSHLWNRFVTDEGMNVLETSNVGNSYGAYEDGVRRGLYPSALDAGDKYSAIESNWNRANYVLEGDPYGLEPQYPTQKSLPEGKPYLSSNTVTAFSILDTGDGKVRSYYFDTENNGSETVLFDVFDLN